MIKLKYPVFEFAPKDDMVYVFYGEKDHKTTNNKLFQVVKYSGDVIIDSSGMKYIIKKAYKVKMGGLWTYFTGQGRALFIEYEYKDAGNPITLDELKKMIMIRFPKSRWFKSTWVDVQEFEEEMDKCNTFEQLALLFRKPPSENVFLRLWRGY
jgi:hypothetical protein